MRLPAALARLLPDLGEISGAERLRASAGALLGLLVTGLVSRAVIGPGDDLPLLIAPMGASAVLLFAVPSSPLAQPWSIVGGNMVSATVGVTAARLIPDPIAAAAIGGALAIACMMLLRCLHPPSGAVALTAVLGGPAVRAAGYAFVFWPVALNSVLLLAAALAFNNVTGRRYPHGRTATPETSAEAVAAVFRAHDEIIDIGPHDVAGLLGEVEAEALPAARCADLMRMETDALAVTSSFEQALDRMLASGRTTLPVVEAKGRCVGLVRQADLLRCLWMTDAEHRSIRPLRRNPAPEPISGILSSLRLAATPDGAVRTLVDAMLRLDVDYCPVLDGDGRIVGAITPPDLLRWSMRRVSR